MSVHCSQPRFAWLAAAPRSTVSTVLSSSTPLRAQVSRQPWRGVSWPKFAVISLKMLRSDGGVRTAGGTENAGVRLRRAAIVAVVRIR